MRGRNDRMASKAEPGTARYLMALFAVVLVALLLAACSSAVPTEEFSQAYTVAPGVVLVVDNGNGAVTVETDDSAFATRTVSVEATLYRPDRVDFSVTERSEELEIVSSADSGIFIGSSPRADITVRVPPGMPVRIETGNGKVKVTGIDGPIDVDTGNGAIVIESAQGDVMASAGNGSITITESSGSFRLTSGNGSISLQAELQHGGTNSVTSGNGSVTVDLPDDTDVSVDAETDNGKIDSEWSLTTIERSDSKRLVGKIGEGSATLRLRTGNGSINLR